jgi:nucleotide-binding universal stress UspA family protein
MGALDAEETKCSGDERTGVLILRRALEAPARQIAENSAVDGGVVVDRMRAAKGNYGFDASRCEYVDLVEAGIIEQIAFTRNRYQGQVRPDCDSRHFKPWPESLRANVGMWEVAGTMDDHSVGSLPFQNILHLTDFSPCSDVAFTWATSLARANQAKLSLLHVVVPDALTYMTPDSRGAARELQEKWAREEMQRIEERLKDLQHEMIVAQGKDVWSAVEAKLKELESNLIVLGTHGRRGLRKMLMGSVAERVLRSSAVPVMTVGYAVRPGLRRDGRFHRVLLATDFAAGSAEAACYAMLVAQRDESELVLVHVCKKRKQGSSEKDTELSVAEVIHRFDEMIPHAEELPRRPEALVEYGEPGERIVEAAARREADLIVMGIRRTTNLFATTHLEIGTAHSVVAQAPCPVMTVRPNARQAA